MGLLQGRRRTRIAGASQVQARAYEGFDDMLMRRESTTVLTAHRAPVDPYAAWLEQRKAEQAPEERPEIRWVYMGPGVARRADEGDGAKRDSLRPVGV